jgi:hypothetical protein
MILDMTQQTPPGIHQSIVGNDGFPTGSGFIDQLTEIPGMYRFDSDMLFDLSTGINNFDVDTDISGTLNSQ